MIFKIAGFAVQYALQHPLQVGGAYALLANPLTRTWALRMIAVTASGALTTSKAGAIITAEELLIPVLGSSRVVAGSAIALAAVGGATTGTAISYGIWGEEGARQALTFYGFDAGAGDANYWGSSEEPGYFNAPGNIKKIWDHYTNW
jgi:hypothetical protein